MRRLKFLLCVFALAFFWPSTAVYAQAAKEAKSLSTDIYVTNLRRERLPGFGRDMQLQVHYEVINTLGRTIRSPKLQTPTFNLDVPGRRLTLVSKQGIGCKLNKNFICAADSLPAGGRMRLVLTYVSSADAVYGGGANLRLHFNAPNGVNLIKKATFGFVKTDFTPPEVQIVYNGINVDKIFTNKEHLPVSLSATDTDKRVRKGRYRVGESTWQAVGVTQPSASCLPWESNCGIWDGVAEQKSFTLAEGETKIRLEATDSDLNIGQDDLSAVHDRVAPVFEQKPAIVGGEVTGEKLELKFTAADPLLNSAGEALEASDISGLADYRWREEKGGTWSAWLELAGQVNRVVNVNGSYADGDTIKIEVEVRDRAGNLAVASASARYKLANIGDAPSGGTWIRPYLGFAPVTSGFGPRWGTFHDGTDYGLACGTNLYAARAGTVVAASNAGVVLGNYSSASTPASYVIISHADGWQSLYWHMNKVAVQVGQKLGQGAYIGKSGNTGYVRGNGNLPISQQGCHLHLELHKNGASVDPEKYLPPQN